MEQECSPTVGSCPGQFTANTMAMVSEVLGLALPGTAMLPAVYSQRLALARQSGAAVMRILRDGGPLPRDLVTRKSIENACAAVAATGGSTNAGLHLPAIAHEAGIRFTLDDVAEVFQRTPLIGDLQPGGRFLARDLHYAGGVSAVIRALLDGGYLHDDALTLSGADAGAGARRHARSGRRRHPQARAEPLHPSGGVVVLKGSLCPDGALIKIAGLGSWSCAARRASSNARRTAPRPSAQRRLPRRRRTDHPQRRPQGRPRHARDARHHRADLRAGHGREGRAAHRRPLLRRDPRHVHRLRLPGSSRRRPHRAGSATATRS